MNIITKIRAVIGGIVSFWEKHKTALKLVEGCLLTFPVAVTLLVGMTFLCGGTLGWWQWWLCLGMGTVGLGAAAKRLGTSCGIALLVWGVFLLGVYLLANLFSARGGVDDWCYHYPAMRLLIEGWNPVYASTPTKLAASMGIDLAELRLNHVLFMSKGVWFFNSAAYFFTFNPYNLTFSLFPFLFLVTSGELWRLLRGYSNFVRVLALILLFLWVPAVNLIVDGTICMAGIGLISAMTRCLRGERKVWLPIAVFSFWMVVAKQMGVLTCFVFWCVFGVGLLWKHRDLLLKAVLLGSGIAVAFLVVCATPYLTSWINYAHPFYPMMSSDAERYPVLDITSDFKMCNEDLRQMGHLGEFCNAYVSPLLTQTYYKWKLDKTTFTPNRYVWWQGHPSKGGQSSLETLHTTPLTDAVRWRLILCFLLFFLLSKRNAVAPGIFLLLGLLVFPTPYLGYLRYVPWIALIQILAPCLVVDWVWRKLSWMRWLGITVCLFICAQQLFQLFIGGAIMIENEMRLEYFLKNPPTTVYASIYEGEVAKRFLENRHSIAAGNEESLKIFGYPTKTGLLNIRLLSREDARLARVAIEPAQLEKIDAYPLVGATGIRYDVATYAFPESHYSEVIKCPNRLLRYTKLLSFAVKHYIVVLPQLIWMRILN